MIDQKAEELLATEDKTIEGSISTSVTQHDEQVSTATSGSSEQIDVADKQETTTSEKSVCYILEKRFSISF